MKFYNFDKSLEKMLFENVAAQKIMNITVKKGNLPYKNIPFEYIFHWCKNYDFKKQLCRKEIELGEQLAFLKSTLKHEIDINKVDNLFNGKISSIIVPSLLSALNDDKSKFKSDSLLSFLSLRSDLKSMEN